MALPHDSYLQQYYKDVFSSLRQGWLHSWPAPETLLSFLCTCSWLVAAASAARVTPFTNGCLFGMPSCCRVGPPVMFVVQGLNVSEASPDVGSVCSVAGCDADSLLNQVAQASRAPWSSWLATPAASWLDDFLTWASPEIPQARQGMCD